MNKISTDIFFGTTQSRYAAFAIFSAIMAVCLFILFTSTDVSLAQRFTIVLFIILFSIPSVFMTLFELTCIVTGGTSKKFWWCHYFAWIVAVIIILYSVIIIISVIMSLFTYNNAMDRVVESENVRKVSKDEANKIAEDMMKEGSKKDEPSMVKEDTYTMNTGSSKNNNNHMNNYNDTKAVEMEKNDYKDMHKYKNDQMTGYENNGVSMYGGYEHSSDKNMALYDHEKNSMVNGSYPSGVYNNPMSQWEPSKNNMNNDSVLNGPHIGTSSSDSVPSPFSMSDYSSF